MDATFGQMCVKLSLEEFNDDLEVVSILDNFLKTSGLDEATRQDSKAYKLDEAAEWVPWADEVRLEMSALTSPDAPHYFRICLRKHLGADSEAEVAAIHRADHRGYQPQGDDVVMVVKDRMASLEVSQIILMVPAPDLGRIQRSPLQPSGTHHRRPVDQAERTRVCAAAEAAYQADAIGEKAHAYLTKWSRGSRRRLPRPAYYSFLAHRVLTHREPGVTAFPLLPPDDPRPVIVRATKGGGNLPADTDADLDVGPLVIAEFADLS